MAYAFLAPWIIGLVVFYLGPVATSAVLSFTDYNIISPAEFTGFDNYEKMIMLECALRDRGRTAGPERTEKFLRPSRAPE